MYMYQGLQQLNRSFPMDLVDAMKNSAVKGIHPEMVSPFPGNGYVSEKLYMLLQLYLQNKSWNPSVELLQCFSELMESSMLPSAAYLQMIAARVTLDNQGRLVLRENGKIILPYEHFANAVMLKHMNGPHGLHLGLEGTVRAVMESYTIGRECFGMEKDFIVEVVQNCPNPACRYYKAQVDMSQKSVHLNAPTYIMESGGPRGGTQVPTSQQQQHGGASSSQFPSPQEGGGSSGGGGPPSHPSSSVYMPPHGTHPHHPPSSASAHVPPPQPHPHTLPHLHRAPAELAERGKQSQGDIGRPMGMPMHGMKMSSTRIPLGPPSGSMAGVPSGGVAAEGQGTHAGMMADPSLPLLQYKLTDFLRANLESLEGLTGAKDLLALQNGIWPASEGSDKKSSGEGQEKIVRTFAEIMMNMARIKSCVRPAMCKPYGKQSEALQKTLVDTIQLVQSLRSILPPPHIAVTSWKDEEHKHRPLQSTKDGNAREYGLGRRSNPCKLP
ncbi:uncharacterized protein LOC124164266 isoform X2 [Ischnura elegans]|uniref:uncharacterized protein LOC124164266 isoform X2 n=1 Tax=Ischnura elegans TaxID=197161 RepID=UPI001ED8B66E|nr:uncharacterized protein LOC124164266 isoform X2 [Ischnura elegans]